MHKVLKAVRKIQDTRYLSWGSSLNIALGSLLLVRVVPPPTEVSPPLLLLLQLPLLHGVDPLTGVSLPCLVGLYVLVQRLLDVVGLDPELALLLGDGAEVSGRGRTSCKV
jgi:hypothetical protein